MDGESYTVPAAFTLPNHMEQFYAFHWDNKMHPQIKAAVSQAFILITRPFPEENDRLARIISSAVLLRCGYDFFLDISLSSFIAKENFRYVKAMKEIIRTENEGDMTYFVEYYHVLNTTSYSGSVVLFWPRGFCHRFVYAGRESVSRRDSRNSSKVKALNISGFPFRTTPGRHQTR